MKWLPGAERGGRQKIILYLFWAGMAVGIILGCMGQEEKVFEAGIPEIGVLHQLRGQEWNGKLYFRYVLWLRLKSILILAVLATTYLGGAVAWLCAFGYGTLSGSVLTFAVLQYGLKGVLLIVVSMMPHYLVYVPAMYGLLMWCLKICREIYYEKVIRGEIRTWIGIRLLQLVFIIAVVITGCLLESYVNPALVKKILNNF